MTHICPRVLQPLLSAGLTLCSLTEAMMWAAEPRGERCSPRAMRYLHSQARTDIELCIKCTNSFQVYGTERCLPRSLTQETCSVSSRIALPRLPRVEEGPHHRVAQIRGRADQLATLLPRFFGINKIFRELLFSCISDYRRTAQSTNIASHHSNCSSVSLLVRI